MTQKKNEKIIVHNSINEIHGFREEKDEKVFCYIFFALSFVVHNGQKSEKSAIKGVHTVCIKRPF